MIPDFRPVETLMQGHILVRRKKAERKDIITPWVNDI